MKVKSLFFILLVPLIFFSCDFEKSELRGYDINLFKDTPLWNLAKLVEAQDTSNFKLILNGNSVDYPDPIYGNTLLTIAVVNQYEKSIAKLLELRADPNYSNRTDGGSAMHAAVASNLYSSDSMILSMLIDFGGDVNGLTEITDWKYHSGLQRSVLYVLTESNRENLDLFKFLVSKGANINMKLDNNLNLLNKSIESKNYKLTYYLLKNGIDFRSHIFTRLNGEKLYIQNVMKEDLIDLNSSNYNDKLTVIKFLESNGIDYAGTPSPQKLIEKAKRKYPNSWKEYLGKY